MDNGQSSVSGNAVIICGSPRSGTTWLHNTLIEIGRFGGIPGDDMIGTSSRSIFLTDENRYQHLLLRLIAAREFAMGHAFFAAALKCLSKLIDIRFGRQGSYLIKSPYFSFFIAELNRTKIGGKFIFTKRSFDAVARSMQKHTYVSKQLCGSYDRFYDMRVGEQNMETKYVSKVILQRFEKEYPDLTPYDRAFFKCLCFSSAFFESTAHLPRENVFVFDYDNFHDSPAQQASFAKFLALNDAQSKRLVASFQPHSHKSSDSSPAHNADFCLAVLNADAALRKRTNFCAEENL